MTDEKVALKGKSAQLRHEQLLAQHTNRYPSAAVS